MDFLDPAKRQAHIRRLFLGYFLIGIAIALASTILVVLSNGYDVDRKTGKVIQNGLIFADSAPESSTIFLNGKDSGGTDKRLTVPAGKYDIELRRKGYDTWKKSVSLDGGSIERLVYPRMFPTKLTSAQTKLYDTAPAFSTQSPDRRWLLVAQPGTAGVFDVFDTENIDRAPTVLTLPAKVLTPAAKPTDQSLELVEWSTDNRHVLLKHTFAQSTEFVVIDRVEPQSTVNVNTLFKLQPTKVSLRDKRFDRLYLYTDATKLLQTADTKTGAVANLLTNVTNFKSYQENTVLYSSEDPALPGKTTVSIWDNGKSYTLRVHQAGAVLLDLARFDGEMFVTTASVPEGRMYIFKDPLVKLKRVERTEVTPFAVMKIANPVKLSFSTNTRFIATQSGSTFAVYDFEDNRRFNFVASGTVPVELKATWMDGHRLLLNQDSKVVVFEFDGNNRRILSDIAPGMIPVFDRDYERLYTLSPLKTDPTKTELVRTSLKLNLKP